LAISSSVTHFLFHDLLNHTGTLELLGGNLEKQNTQAPSHSNENIPEWAMAWIAPNPHPRVILMFSKEQASKTVLAHLRVIAPHHHLGSKKS
jgi:hypothetical protein